MFENMCNFETFFLTIFYNLYFKSYVMLDFRNRHLLYHYASRVISSSE